jgi:hypothetical protein
MTQGSPPERSVDQEVARITSTYSTHLRGIEPADFEAAVWAEFARRSEVTIKEYVPVFVERSVRTRYGLGASS